MMSICQKETIFFSTHAITILSLFTYSVCDEKVKIVNFFCVFFSAMNVNTKFENVSFLKKSKIFSDRTFGFLYSLLGK